MKPWFHGVLTHWNPGFTASGTTVISLGPSLLPVARQYRFADVPSAFQACFPGNSRYHSAVRGMADRRVIMRVIRMPGAVAGPARQGGRPGGRLSCKNAQSDLSIAQCDQFVGD
jgi:hypothetical protein